MQKGTQMFITMWMEANSACRSSEDLLDSSARAEARAQVAAVETDWWMNRPLEASGMLRVSRTYEEERQVVSSVTLQIQKQSDFAETDSAAD